ncbi:MAG: hypothetical protein R3250_03215 [Melioribacteraceae bacterium]|nr:hypothetical protein [Melioribacteraceae bacterium]
MANPILRLMVDSFPDSITGLTNQISQLDESLTQLQEEKDALIQAMNDIRQEAIDSLTPQADFVYYGPAFYPGGEDDDASRSINVSDWRAFNIVAVPENQTEYYNITLSPLELEVYNDGSDPLILDPVSTWTPHEEVTETIDTTVIDEKVTDFAYITDYIHKPVIEMDGFYGINDKLSQLNLAKSNLQKDMDKYSDGISVLGRYV